MCVVAAVLTVLNLLLKLPCTDTAPSVLPRDAVVSRFGCFSDIEFLWDVRQLASHVFPYVTGSDIGNGTVEYPTLTGVWIWLTALPVDTARGFLVVTAAVAVVIVVVVTLLLARIDGRRAWIWAATPPLALYAVSNWDLLPVVCTVVGLVAVVRPPARWSTTTRYAVAGLAFGLGGAFKLYPLMFLAPLAIAALLDRDVALAARVKRTVAALGSGIGVVLAANVPFALINLDGWLSVFRFQAGRPISPSTMSIWFYGLMPWSMAPEGSFQTLMGTLSTVTTAIGILAVLVVTVVLALRRGTTPWIESAAALLAVYMVCNKVASPQYVLWLLPFFVVVRIGGWWIAAYLVADICAFVGFFRNTFYIAVGIGTSTWANQAMAVGIWGRAALLVAFAVVFFRVGSVVDGRDGNGRDGTGRDARDWDGTGEPSDASGRGTVAGHGTDGAPVSVPSRADGDRGDDRAVRPA